MINVGCANNLKMMPWVCHLVDKLPHKKLATLNKSKSNLTCVPGWKSALEFRCTWPVSIIEICNGHHFPVWKCDLFINMLHKTNILSEWVLDIPFTYVEHRVLDDLHAHSVNVGYFPVKVCDLLCISELKRFTSFEGLWVLFERLKILRLRWCVQTRILVFCFSFKKESVPCMQMEYAVGFNWCDASHCYNLYYRTRWDEAFEL